MNYHVYLILYISRSIVKILISKIRLLGLLIHSYLWTKKKEKTSWAHKEGRKDIKQTYLSSAPV